MKLNNKAKLMFKAVFLMALPFLISVPSNSANADDDEIGACRCTVNLTGQSWCTETTYDWCNSYTKTGALSCSWSYGSCN